MDIANFTEKSSEYCIRNCTECHRVTEQAIQYCLAKGGEYADPQHVRLLRDTAEITAVAANFLLRGSELQPETSAACASACEACAEECEALALEDEVMNICVETCLRCAESCRAMVEVFQAA